MEDALRSAARRGELDDLRACLDAGTDIESKDKRGYTATISAAAFGHIDCLKLLIERGANVNAATNVGQTSAYLAFLHGRKEVMRMLVNAGLDVNAVICNGDTVLHWAARRGDTRTAAMVLEAGARKDIKNSYDCTPAEVADYKGKTDMAAAIRSFSLQRLLRVRRCIGWRRAVDARRDAGMVFQAASEGRPMELARRLRLGKLVGRLEIKGTVTLGDGSSSQVLPVEAARLGGHDECVRLLEEAAGL